MKRNTVLFFTQVLSVILFFSCSIFSPGPEKEIFIQSEKFSDNFESYRKENLSENEQFLENVSKIQNLTFELKEKPETAVIIKNSNNLKQILKRLDIQASHILNNDALPEEVLEYSLDMKSDLKSLNTYKDLFEAAYKPFINIKILLLIIIMIIISVLFCYGIFRLKLMVQLVFTQKILRAQEQERLRISTELHDTIAQNLKSIQLKSENLENDEITSLSKKSITLIRALCYNLMPPDFVMSESGVKPRLEHLLAFLCRDVSDKGMSCHFFADENIPLFDDSEKLLNVFRIVQEALNNAVKHSQAEQCSVLLKSKDEDKILIFITDDGKGIPEEVLQKGKINHYGIQSMHIRAKMIGAKLTINSKKDEGTEVRLEVKV